MYDPSLMLAPNVGGMIQQGIDQGQQDRQQTLAKGAMAALVRDPTNQRALEALASVDPQAAMQFKQQQQQQSMAGLEQHRDNILKGAQIFRQLGVKDEAGYQQARQIANQMGIPLNEVPPNYDPQYVQGVVSIADAFAPQQQHNPQIVPVAPGGGVATIDPATHGLQFLALPNDGSHPAGSPAVTQVHDQASYDAVPPGGQYMAPDGHVRVKQGGQAATPSATFP